MCRFGTAPGSRLASPTGSRCPGNSQPFGTTRGSTRTRGPADRRSTCQSLLESSSKRSAVPCVFLPDSGAGDTAVVGDVLTDGVGVDGLAGAVTAAGVEPMADDEHGVLVVGLVVVEGVEILGVAPVDCCPLVQAQGPQRLISAPVPPGRSQTA